MKEVDDMRGKNKYSTIDENSTDVILCFQEIKVHSPLKPVLIFVSSRRQTRITALDLISFSAADSNPK